MCVDGDAVMMNKGVLRLLVFIVMRYVAPLFVGVFDTIVCWCV